MKKTVYLLSTIGFVCILSQTVYAQTANIPANATVIAQISVVENNATNFGDVAPDLSPVPTLDAFSVTSSSGVSGTFDLGFTYITGEGGKSVSVSWTEPVTLTGANDNTFTMDFTPSIFAEAGDHRLDSPEGGGAEIVNSGDAATLDGTTNDLTLWVGGTLGNPQQSSVAVTNLDAQVYSGTLTLTLDYSF